MSKLFCFLLLLPCLFAQKFDPESVLPPRLAWKGGRSQMRPASDSWATPFERSKGLDTATGAETLAWLERLAKQSPQLKFLEIGRSAEDRPIWMALLSQKGASNAAELRANGLPTLLIQAGIHAGEIDGKDAGLMFLRDLLLDPKRAELLNNLNLLFIPILNPDGHENHSPYHRINQRGPAELGWRTNGRNLNLNRDYAKLDCAETRAVVQVLVDYQPELYLDIHVTDGMDYQYDITFGHMGPHAYSPNLSNWLSREMTPTVSKALLDAGHQPGPLLFAMNNNEPSGGLIDWLSGPRYSNAYGDARHLATVLVENHSLKPFEQRVLGTYVLIEASAKMLASKANGLRGARALDEKRRPEQVPYLWTATKLKEQMNFLAVGAQELESKLTGAKYWSFDGKPLTILTPYLVLGDKPLTLARPKGYWIPAAYGEILTLLKHHGISVSAPQTQEVEVERLRFDAPKWANQPFEGRFRLTAPHKAERMSWRPDSSWRFATTDQALGDLLILLLEPESPDSFFQWGFFASIFQRTEYFENYAGEPLAAKMLEDPTIAKAYAKKQADPEFAKDPQAVLQWFFDQSPYRDQRWRVYPILRQP